MSTLCSLWSSISHRALAQHPWPHRSVARLQNGEESLVEPRVQGHSVLWSPGRPFSQPGTHAPETWCQPAAPCPSKGLSCS